MQVNTGRTGFTIPHKLIKWDSNEIITEATFKCDEGWIITELAAQTAGLHVRLSDDLNHQVFLLKMKSAPIIADNISGHVRAYAKLISNSCKAYEYVVEVLLNETCYNYNLIIGTREYTDEAEKSRITEHFRKVIDCLKIK